MKKILGSSLLIALCLSCSQQRYAISEINTERFAVEAQNSNSNSKSEIQLLVDEYKFKLDKEMNQVIAKSQQEMPYGRPESLLTNLTSDVMLAYANKHFNNSCDLASMNVHGHRANMPKGDITVGNIFEIYSFENTLVFIKLKGKDLMDAFRSYAKMGGAGISSTVHLKIKDGKLIEALLKGQPIDENKIYNIITLDYLADGNDGLEAFKNATEAVETGTTLRDAMMQYVKDQTSQGKKISSVIDGRITIVQ